MEIDTLAGEDLDHAVATRVLERQVNPSIRLRYSSDLASAWDVVKKVTGEQPSIEFRIVKSGGWLTVIFYDPRTAVEGVSRSRQDPAASVAGAVCRAALKFVARWEARAHAPWPALG